MIGMSVYYNSQLEIIVLFMPNHKELLGLSGSGLVKSAVVALHVTWQQRDGYSQNTRNRGPQSSELSVKDLISHQFTRYKKLRTRKFQEFSQILYVRNT